MDAVSAKLLTPASLPADILRNSARRLRIAAIVWIILWGTGLVMNNVVGPIISPGRSLDDAWPWPGNPVASGCILLSLVVVLSTRRDRARMSVLLNLSLVYEVALAFGIGVVNQWTPNVTGLSWICVLVLVHPLIVPNTPSRTFIASMLAASMDLVGLAITGARGVPLPGWQVLLWTYLPNFLCAGLAVAPAHLIARLGREAKAARELGSYVLGERLGQGGMGEVHRARHRLLARDVAVKIVRPELFGSSVDDALVTLHRFEREAQVTARMRSPHTIEVYDYGLTGDGVFYYVMELLDGFDLDVMVRRFGPQPATRVIHVLEQVCDSLAEAHENQLIHRDIKPANVHLCRYGRRFDFVKLLDFGLVKGSAADRPEPAIETEHRFGGTPGFMAPEQALGKPLDHRSDLYAVGCLGYWLLTGQPVFAGKTAFDVIHQHADSRPVPPSARTELEVPECLDQAILACLEKEPERRPKSADALAEGLVACTRETGTWTQEQARAWWKVVAPAAVATQPVALRS